MKHALKILVLCMCFLLLSGCQIEQKNVTPTRDCPAQAVCGADLKIYANKCLAEDANIKIIAQNKCPTSVTQAIEFIIDGTTIPTQYIQKNKAYEIRITNKLDHTIILNSPSLNAVQSVAPGTTVKSVFTPRLIGEHTVYVDNKEVTKIIIR